MHTPRLSPPPFPALCPSAGNSAGEEAADLRLRLQAALLSQDRGQASMQGAVTMASKQASMLCTACTVRRVLLLPRRSRAKCAVHMCRTTPAAL